MGARQVNRRTEYARRARSDNLVQTVLQPGLAAWVKTQAKAEGISVAAWLRRLIMRERARGVRAAQW